MNCKSPVFSDTLLNNQTDFSWVDEYFVNVRSYISVRTHDNLLIKRPNVVHKLNTSGTILLENLLNGYSIQELIKVHSDPAKQFEIYEFLKAIRECIDNKDTACSENSAIDHQLFTGSFHTLPVLSEIALTYKCNLKCAFCYAACGEVHPVKETVSFESGKRLIDIICNDAKVPSVSFTGGEPMLNKNIYRLIAYAKKRDMRVNLITNGTLISAKSAKELKSSGLDSAQVSLEGVNAQSHELLTQIPGSYDKTVRGIDNLNGAGITTHTNTTLTKANCENAVSIPQFVKDRFGFTRCSMNLIIPTGSGLSNRSLFIAYSDAGPIIWKIHDAARLAEVEFMWYSPLPMCIFNTVGQGLGAKGCSACDGLLSIGPDGSVLPCSAYPEPVGNVLTQQFTEIWQSSNALKIREKKIAPQGCQNCEDFALCNGACPLYWNVFGCDELKKKGMQNGKI
jgi:radical SAM protein with 4Fe4S-binding SPASM domain